MTTDSEAIKQQQNEIWSAASSAWRKHQERLQRSSRPITDRMLELAQLKPGSRVLDIACGPGDPGLVAAERVGPDGFVLLTDMSEQMLAVAQENAAAQNLQNVAFQNVDGESLDVDPASFDVATCRFGIMFMPDATNCLRQVNAALKPGGRLVVAVWGSPQQNPFISVAAQVVMKHAGTPPPDPEAPGPFAFADRTRLSSTLENAGFDNVEIEDMTLTMADFATGREYTEFSLEVVGPIGRIVRSLPADKQALIREDMAAAATGGNPDGPVSLAGCAVLASATKR